MVVNQRHIQNARVRNFSGRVIFTVAAGGFAQESVLLSIRRQIGNWTRPLQLKIGAEKSPVAYILAD